MGTVSIMPVAQPTYNELAEALEKEIEHSKKLKELLGWIKDITQDYEANPKAGLQAIRILINNKKLKKEKAI